MPAPTRNGTGSVRRGERTSAVVPFHIPQARRVSPQAPPELQDAVPSKAARNLSGIVYRYVPSRIPFSHAMRVPLRKRRPREHIPFNRHRKRQHRSRTHHERFVPAVPPFPTRLSKSGFSRREDRSHAACGPMRNAGPRPTTGCPCGIEAGCTDSSFPDLPRRAALRTVEVRRGMASSFRRRRSGRFPTRSSWHIDVPFAIRRGRRIGADGPRHGVGTVGPESAGMAPSPRSSARSRTPPRQTGDPNER